MRQRGLLTVKKLFQLSPLLELNAYHTLKIIGPYQMEMIDHHACRFLHEEFIVSLEGEAIQIDALQTEQVVVSIENFQTMTIEKLKHNG